MSWKGGIVSLFYPESVLTVNSGNLEAFISPCCELAQSNTHSWHEAPAFLWEIEGWLQDDNYIAQGDKSPSAKIVLCM